MTLPAMHKVAVRVVREDKEFSALQSIWNTLLCSSSANNVFLTWEWAFTWWQHYRDNKELFILLAEEEGVLIGIAPVYITRSRYFGLAARRHVEFISTTSVCAEYLDFIIQQGREQEVLAALLEKLYACRNKWDIMNLVSLRADACTSAFLREYTRNQKPEFTVYASRQSPYIPLPASRDAYNAAIGRRSRNKLKSYQNKLDELQKLYTVTVEILHEAAQLEKALQAIIALHQKRWTEKGGAGSFAEQRNQFQRFHQDIASRFFAAEWLYVVFLNVNGERIAGQYSYLYNNKIYCYSVGFDPAWAEYKVGSVLQLLVVDDAIRRGIAEFDFLQGMEDYKFIWTKSCRESINVVSWRSAGVRRAVAVEKAARKLLRKILPRKLVHAAYNKLTLRDDEAGE